MNDVVKEEAELNLEKSGCIYPEEVRKRYVKLFLASQPITMTEFAAQHGLDRKSIRRWLDKYGVDYAQPKRWIHNTAHETTTKLAAVRPAPLRSASDNDTNAQTVTIPYTEYLSLLQEKAKLDTIRAVSQ